MRRPPARLGALLCFPVIALGVAACGSSAKTTPSVVKQAPAAGSSYTPPAVTGPAGQKPTIATPTGTPPTTLVSKDITVGKGAAVVSGDALTVQYLGVLYSNGKEFDASYDRNQPFAFTIGQGMVIPGWDQGILGMKVGGRRELVIPPALAYGATGAGSAVPANATLIFVVDLLKIG